MLLTESGPQAEHALVVETGKLVFVGPRRQLPAADAQAAPSLPGHAIIPGFVDAHTHLAQTFGKILIGGEPAQIWPHRGGPRNHSRAWPVDPLPARALISRRTSRGRMPS